MPTPPATATVGEVIAAFLERCGLATAFGVISIHNMPILDAFNSRGRIRFVPARGEAGATNMADAYARVSGGIGVSITSTGTAAGNACGAMVEALTAGTPLVHITGQIEQPWLDRDWGYIHEARDQLAMLGAVSKRAFRVRDPQTALGTVKEAIRLALTPPTGPVSIEIPIDIQAAPIAWPADLDPIPIDTAIPDARALDALADALAGARRPMLWLGGGARGATKAVERLVALGFGIVTSVQGRGVLPEDHPMTLGATNMHGPVEAFYQTCDAAVVVGSRLRSNETLKYKLKLPRPLYRVDVDAVRDGQAYPSERFVRGDAALVLEGLADRLAGRLTPDPTFAGDLQAARATAEAGVRKGLGPYARLVDELQAAAGRNFVWARDVTVSNSTWGNRLLRIAGPRDGVHAMGGGIGMGIQMALGAALAAEQRTPAHRAICLTGDGGLMLNVGELATLVQEKANVAIVLMNDRGYGVIRNIQDAQYGGRRCYTDLHTPDFETLARSIALPYARVASMDEAAAKLDAAMTVEGPVLVEIDMVSIGPFASAFAGPPVKEKEGVKG